MARDRLEGRCRACAVLLAHCICSQVPRLDTAVELVVVRHEREALRSTNTVRIAAMALPRLTVVDYGQEPPLADAELRALGAAEACLVYPAEPRSAWPGTPPQRLVFLDGSWSQTRKMEKKLRSLAPLPRLWLPEAAGPPALRLRCSETPGGRSTLEGIAESLRLVGEPEAGGALLELAAAHVRAVLQARGRVLR